MSLDTNEEPLKLLLKRYSKREDLQDAYPEVKEGDYQALINWASGVSSKSWLDGDNELLSQFQGWYLKKQKAVVRAKNEDTIRDILKQTRYSMNHTLSNSVQESDICDHLPTLYFLTIEFKLKNILELGVRNGLSTIALTEAASKINGHVWSIDKENCNKARQTISTLNLDSFWTFMKGDDIEIGKKWDKLVDHIFIDTSHAYRHTLEELNMYGKFLNVNGFITFHDTRSYPGVLKAVRDFLQSNNNNYTFYNYFNNNGFAILRRIG